MKYDAFSKQIEESCGIRPKRLDVTYNESDSRCWSAVVDKDNTNIIVTYHVNKGDYGNRCFDILYTKNPILNVEEGEIFDTLKTLIKN
jgi:hypothetical protein